MFRGRKIVAEAPARQASPRVQKLTIQAASCDVPPELVERDAEQEGPEEPSRKADAGIEPDRCPSGPRSGIADHQGEDVPVGKDRAKVEQRLGRCCQVNLSRSEKPEG